MMKEQNLKDILAEAETSEDTECVPCRIAAGIGITRNICEEFKGKLNCREFMTAIDQPENHTLDEVQALIENIAKNAKGKRAKELLTYTACLMKGECSVDQAPPSLKE